MSVKDPVHLLFGYVEIKGENGFCERFINLCTASGIPLWDIHKRSNEITAKTTIGGYKKIRSPAKESSMHIKLIKKHGLPFIINRCMRYTGLAIGFAVMIVALSILSGRIWLIEIDNDTAISDELITNAYEDAGLTIGRSKRLDLNTLCSDVSESLSDTSWTTVNVVGSTATIKVREVRKTPQIDYGKGTSNIVALKDGQVEIIEPYRGSPAIIEGQTVSQGDLLISGVTESRIYSNLFSDADGYVVANTTIDVSHSTPAEIPALKKTQRKIYSLYFLGREIPLGRVKDSDCAYRHKEWLEIGGKKMPFGLFYTLSADFEEQAVKLGSDEILLTAINDYSLNAYHQTLHSQNISKDVSVDKNANEICVRGRYHCYENIGQKVPLEIEESEAEAEKKPVE
ncbi:MAG: sporulation protein YqfD [Clostridia bacterium]|nr:sporulation protein YqfD [Clostridia bacterium]